MDAAGTSSCFAGAKADIQAISAGFFVANWAGYGCQFIKGEGQWRVPLALQNVPALLLFVGMLYLPYSPRWLAKVGRTEEARSTLVRLHGGRRADMAAVDAEINAMLAQIEWERSVKGSYVDLIRGRANLHRTVAACAVQAMTQFSGINVNSYYGPQIYNALGESHLSPLSRALARLLGLSLTRALKLTPGFNGTSTLLINGISGAWGMLCVWVFITFLVDRIGRRRPLIIGSVLLSLVMAWQAGTNAPFDIHKRHGESYTNESVGIAGIAATFVFSWFFSWSFGPVSWIYQSEIFPLHLRARGTSVATMTNWACNVGIAQATPVAFEHIGWRYFLVFVVCNLANGVGAYLLFPETKGRTLEEIAVLFGDTSGQVRPVVSSAATSDLESKVSGASSPGAV